MKCLNAKSKQTNTQKRQGKWRNELRILISPFSPCNQSKATRHDRVTQHKPIMYFCQKSNLNLFKCLSPIINLQKVYMAEEYA